jgi:DNA repair protein RadC
VNRSGFHGRNELWEVDFSKRRGQSSSDQIRAILESRKCLYTVKGPKTLVHPREVFADAVTDRATAIICAHNHPSGNVTPSADDRLVTQSLQQAGEILGVRLIDHIIFSARGFYSFLDHGEL